MAHDSLRLTVGGAEADEELYRDLIRAEVELDEELAGMCRLTLAASSWGRTGGGATSTTTRSRPGSR